VKSVSPKFYDFNIYARAVRQENARAMSARDYPESTPERRMSLLRFCYRIRENRPTRLLKNILTPVLRFQ